MGDIVHCFRLRYGGMLLRALEGEMAMGNGTPAISRRARESADVYEEWADEADGATPMPPAPIRDLVATQYRGHTCHGGRPSLDASARRAVAASARHVASARAEEVN